MVYLMGTVALTRSYVQGGILREPFCSMYVLLCGVRGCGRGCLFTAHIGFLIRGLRIWLHSVSGE